MPVRYPFERALAAADGQEFAPDDSGPTRLSEVGGRLGGSIESAASAGMVQLAMDARAARCYAPWREMPPNTVTIADVAIAAGVSRQTVSRVINGRKEVSGPTRAHVLSIIEELGYRPSTIARSLATNQTYSIGLVVPDIVNPFFPEIARGAEDAGWERGYGMFLYNTGESNSRERAALQLLGDKKVDGVIICSPRQPDEDLFPLLERHKSVVVVNRSVPEELGSSIRIDNTAGTAQIVRHLLSAGRRSLAMLAGPPASPSGQERGASFRATLAAAGQPSEPERIVHCGAGFPDSLNTALEVLQRGTGIDALVCYDDVVAAAAIHACGQLGLKVPEDVAVVGYDDTQTAVMVTPALTTMRVPMYDIGAQAATMLIDRIGGGANRQHVVSPQLVVRASAPYGRCAL